MARCSDRLYGVRYWPASSVLHQKGKAGAKEPKPEAALGRRLQLQLPLLRFCFVFPTCAGVGVGMLFHRSVRGRL